LNPALGGADIRAAASLSVMARDDDDPVDDVTPGLPLRVLQVEDSDDDAALVLRELRRGGFDPTFERVDTQVAFKDALRRSDWEVIISDYSLPHYNGLTALADMQQAGKDIPFILVSGTIGEETAVEAMRAGAHDYVLKDRLTRLAPAVLRVVRESKSREARSLAEDALRESEARFRRLAESGIIGITIADVHGNILEANDTYLKMVGYSLEELVHGSVRWADLTPPEFAHLAARSAEQLQASGVAPPWETESFRKDGSRVPMLVGVAMLDHPRCIAVMADLTQLKRSEASEGRLVLEAEGHQSGRMRAEKALRQSEEQLRQAHKMEAVGRLAGGVAHDFNNVLSVILSYGDMLLADIKPDDPMREAVEEIQKAGNRAADLTRQLLMFSRQQVLEPKVIDLNEVLTSMDKMLQRTLGADVDLVSLPTPALGRVRADPSSVEQVIMNLVVNARDAMPTGGRLTIETSNVVLDEAYSQAHLGVRPGPHVMLAVTDGGTGIPKETLARIFEPFFTTKAIGKGTGLGLSTVFGIVQQSGGSVWVYSEPGVGTTFKVYLPRVDAAVEAARVVEPPTTLRGSETILLVDDDDQVRVVARGILQRGGYHVIDARHAGEALLHSEEYAGTIHLLLSDVVMPQMGGPALAKRLASTRPDMKVLCMSGYTDDSIVRHGVLEAHIAYLQKPFTPGALTTKVREVLDASNLRIASVRV
jgi:two-component system, cell cycle sensor histidine kinase and response regulator CckA